MLKINQIYGIKFFILITALFLLISTLTYSYLKYNTLQKTTTHLKNVLVIIETTLDNKKSLDTIVSSIHKKTDIRITMINLKGKVIAESNIDKTSMNNHLLRKEILDLENEKYGTETRYSNTLKKEFLYVAKKVFYNTEKIYVRVSLPLESVVNSFFYFWIFFTLIFVLALSLVYLLLQQNKRNLIHDIEELHEYLNEINSKNYDAKVEIKHHQELLHIAVLLKNLVKRVNNKDKKKKIKSLTEQ